MLRTTALAAVVASAFAINNGKGIRPPGGWRDWNQYQRNISQDIMQSVMDAMVARTRYTWDNKLVSLADLGYNDAGLDDAWQLCGSYPGPNGQTFNYHNSSGYPLVNYTRFPDLKGMTDYGHALNLTVGFYSNNCICAERAKDSSFYYGDVSLLVSSGFDSVKLDGCGTEMDLTLWSTLIAQQSPTPVLIENCHWGFTLPNASWCPFNYYRTSTDSRPTFGSVLNNLYSVPPLADANLSTPGCWAYPDMLEVGVTNSQSESPPLSYVESRTQFGAWSIVSSPLILGLNVTDGPTVDAVWDIISNTEAIGVNQAYTGHSGTLYASASTNTTFTPCTWIAPATCTFPIWQKLYKRLPGGKTALMVINSAPYTATLSLAFGEVPGLSATAKYAVRDVWAHADLGVFQGSYTAVGLTPHDSAFIILTPQ